MRERERAFWLRNNHLTFLHVIWLAETYLGTGDHHNPEFDYLGIHSPLLELDSFAVKEQKYKGAPIDEQFCPYTLHVYPSDAMYEQQTTNVGTTFALAAIGIFAVTSSTYILVVCVCLPCVLHAVLTDLARPSPAIYSCVHLL